MLSGWSYFYKRRLYVRRSSDFQSLTCFASGKNCDAIRNIAINWNIIFIVQLEHIPNLWPILSLLVVVSSTAVRYTPSRYIAEFCTELFTILLCYLPYLLICCLQTSPIVGYFIHNLCNIHYYLHSVLWSSTFQHTSNTNFQNDLTGITMP